MGIITDVSGAQKCGDHEQYDYHTKIKVLFLFRFLTKAIIMILKCPQSQKLICM